MADPEWLVNGDPEQVVAALDGAVGREEAAAAAVYRASGHLHRESGAQLRRQVLALDAARYGHRELARGIAAVAVGGDTGDPWVVQWATGTGLDSRLRYALPAPATVGAVATVVVADRGLAVAGCEDGTLHWWDLATGRKLGSAAVGDSGAAAAGDSGAVRALVTTVLDGRPVAVTAHSGGSVRVWALVAGEGGGEPVVLYPGEGGSWINSLATVPIEGRPVVVGGSVDGRVRVWDPAAPAGRGELLSIRTGTVRALATAVVDGRPVVVTGHGWGTVRRWDLLTGREFGAGSDPVGESHARTDPSSDPGPGPDADFDADSDIADGGGRQCATMEINAMTHVVATDPAFESPLAVSANAYETCIRDLATGEQVGEPGPGFVEAAAVSVLRGRPVALLAGSGGPVHVWDLSASRHLRPPLIGHRGTVRAAATAVVKDRHFAVTGGDDESVRVWDLDGERDERVGSGAGRRPAGHTGPVHRVTTAVVDGRSVIVTGAEDGTVRVWDLDGGEQLGEPLAGHTAAVSQVTVATVEGRPVLLTRDRTRTVRVLDLTTREELHGRSTQEYSSSFIDFFGAVEDRFVAVTWEGRVWDLTASAWIGVQPKQRCALALESLAGRHVILTGCAGEPVHLWDMVTGDRIGPSFVGLTGRVRAGAAGMLDGRPVVAAGGDDGTARVWDATTGRQIGAYAFPADVRGLAVTPDGRLVVAFGTDITVLAHRVRR
ncbi:WD40 repeat domain-containing protein [Kitasatospora sp. NPDC085464]|uniref:WD40 repeat domain-containing protein n=1 Tax=Kitasatospora sp. NPDC085464 TaxID=3364063 RepID=UPI0037C94A23